MIVKEKNISCMKTREVVAGLFIQVPILQAYIIIKEVS